MILAYALKITQSRTKSIRDEGSRNLSETREIHSNSIGHRVLGLANDQGNPSYPPQRNKALLRVY